MTVPELAYIALAVADPGASAEFFEDAFGLPRDEFVVDGRTVPVIRAGRTALALFASADPFLGSGAVRGVHHVAIAADDPPGAAAAAGIPTCGEPSSGPGGRCQVALAPSETLGVRVRLTEPLETQTASSDVVERVDHIGIASTDNRAARDIFTGRLTCRYESQQTDSEVETIAESFTTDTDLPVFHVRRSRLVASMRVTFITVGDTELEFLEDLTTRVRADEARHDAAGNTRGDRSAIARFIATRGAGLHHVAFKTPDIAAALARLDAAGHRLIDRRGRPGSRRAQIGFIHPAASGGVLLHFVQREELRP